MGQHRRRRWRRHLSKVRRCCDLVVVLSFCRAQTPGGGFCRTRRGGASAREHPDGNRVEAHDNEARSRRRARGADGNRVETPLSA